MLTKDLETKLINAIRSAWNSASVGTDCQILGAWQTTAASIVKNIEDESSPAFLYCCAGTPSQTTFSDPNVSFAFNLTLFVRMDLDVTGSLLVSLAEPIENLLRGWQSSTYQSTFTALDIPGLSVDEVSVQGGTPATIDRQLRVVSVNWPITLAGSYRPLTTTTSTNN